VARDRILTFLRPFGKGSAGRDEPRRALIVTGLLTYVVLAWAMASQGEGALNIVAQIITGFFLYTYGMLNVAAFIEAVGDNPSFRPRFRFFHWVTALAGGVGCIIVAFIINPLSATAAIVILASLVWYIKQRELRMSFGDARRGFLYKAVRNNLMRLAEMQESPKNWRPTSLVFSGNPESRETLVTYAVWLEAGRGIVFLANILEGSFEDFGPHRHAAVRQLNDFCRKRGIHAFPVVIIDESLERGISIALQATSVGPIEPNLAVFGWSEHPDRVKEFVGRFRTVRTLGLSLVVVRLALRPMLPGRKRVDVWWRGMKNGNLMILLAHLLTQNWEWSHTDVRLLRLVENEEAQSGTREDLEQLIRNARIEAVARVIVDDRPFADVLLDHSRDADCLFLGFDVPEEGEEIEWFHRHEDMLKEMPTTILVWSAGEEDILA
jgi:hypothetical protein